MRFAYLVGLVTLCLFVSSTAYSDVPKLINYQGRLTNSAGFPVADSIYSVTFTIYDQLSEGNSLWSEMQSVSTSDGLFSVLLGTFVTLPDNIFDDVSRYVGVTVNPDPEIMPRQRIVSNAYSYRVQTVDGATGGTIFGNVSIQSDLAVDGTMNAKNMVLSNLGPQQTPLTIQGSAGQSANLMEIKDASGLTFVLIGANGDADLYGKFGVNGPVVVQADAGQTANLMEIKNSAGAPLVTIEPDGDMDGLNSNWENLQAIDINCDGTLDVNGPVVVQADAGQTANLQEWRKPIAGGSATVATVDALGNVGIGTGTPHSNLYVNGSFATNVVNKTGCLGPIVLNETHSVVLVTTLDCVNCGVQLPTAAGIQGRQYTIKHIIVQPSPGCPEFIYPFGSETIDGNPFYSLPQNKFVTVVSDGSNWWVIGSN